MSEGDSFTRSGEDGTRGFWFGGFFHMLRSGQPRMPPQERLHEGFWFFVWGIVAGAGAGRGASTHCVSPVERHYEGFKGLAARHG